MVPPLKQPGSNRRADRRALTWAVSAVLSVAVIVLVAANLDWSQVYDTFTHLNWGYLALAFLVFLINYALRTLRFQTLIYTQRLPFRRLMGVTSLYGTLLYLMPAKSGELSFPLLLKQRMDVSLVESTATLITARFFDFATIALFLPVVLVVFWADLPGWMIIASVIFCGLVYLTGLVTIWFLRTRLSDAVPARPGEDGGHRWIARLTRAWRNLLKGLQLIDQRGQYWRLLLLTTGIWLCVYTNFYLIVLSMGYRLSYFEIIVVSIIMVPLTLLPIQGIANLGTHEAGWVGALALFGESQETSLAIAVGSHTILLVFVLLLGGLGLLLQGGRYRPEYELQSRGAND